MEIELTINGEKKKVEISPQEKLLDMLRRLGYYGVKKGCRTGNCGACTVLLDGKAVASCLIFAGNVQGKEVVTIEALGTPNEPHKIQKAFSDAGAVQCGYCIPGQILSTKALLDENPKPSSEEVKTALDGNLCRCTGYVKILDAVKKVVEEGDEA